MIKKRKSSRFEQETVRCSDTEDPLKVHKPQLLLPDSTAMEDTTHAAVPDGVNERMEETEERNIEEVKAPVQLKREFLRALKDKDLPLASQLCQIILIYEPDNPEASEFLPLIKNKLLKEREAEHSSEGESEDDTGSDEESQSSSSSSPSDDDDDDDDDENGV